MTELAGFVKQVGLVLIGALVAGGIPLYAYADAAAVRAAAVGCGICTLNVLVSCLSISWAFEKPYPVFLKVLFGGMAVRLVAIGAIFYLLVGFTAIHVAGLTLSMVLFYVLFQILEIRFLIGHLSARQVSDN